jgi:hypothetical protein
MEIFQLGKIANCCFSLYYIRKDVDVSMIYVNYSKPGYFMKTMLDNNLNIQLLIRLCLYIINTNSKYESRISRSSIWN